MGLWTKLRDRLFGTPEACSEATSTIVDDGSVVSPTSDHGADSGAAAEASTLTSAPVRPASIVEPEPGAASPGAPIADDPTAAPSVPGELAVDADVATRQERAATSLLDDERLRGDLADDEYQPLLDWALAVTDRVAAATGGLDDRSADSVLESRVAEVKAIVSLAGEAVAAHVEEATSRRTTLFEELAERIDVMGLKPGAAEEACRRLGEAADRLEKDGDVSGAEVASSIAAALSPVSSAVAPAKHEEAP
jgi:hypothetical protein